MATRLAPPGGWPLVSLQPKGATADISRQTICLPVYKQPEDEGVFSAKFKKNARAIDFYIIAPLLGGGLRRVRGSVCDAVVCAKARGSLFDLPHVAAQTQRNGL